MVDLQILYFKLFIITFLKMSFFIHEVPIPISYFVSSNGKSKNREKILIFLNEIWKIAIEKQQEDATLKKPLLKASAIKPSQKRKHMKEIPEHFQGSWITTAEFCNLRPQNMFHRQLDTGSLPVSEPERQNRHILFRKKFTMKGAVSTVIRISGDDYYKLYINGVRVGQGPAAGYPFHYFYNEIDISRFVHAGVNTLAVHSYYQGLINRVWVSGDRRHGVIFDLLADGELIACSDESVRCREHSGFVSAGITGYQTQFLECYDAAAPEVGFERPEFDDSGWECACIHRHADYRLFRQPSEQLTIEEIRPEKIEKCGASWRIDFGGIFVGSLRFRASGDRGLEVVMYFAQELEPDGSLRWKLRANCAYKESFLLSRAEWDVLNQFDYKSFRYAELQCPPGCRIDPESIVLEARHYPFVLRAVCNRNDEKSLAVWKLCVDSLRYGVQEVIQDCMEREKGYYLGDGCYSLLTFCLLTRDYTLMEKFFDDFLRTAFVNRGLMTCAACSFMQEIAEYPLIMFGLLLEYCHLSGNRDFVRERYAAFADILDFYRENYAEADGLLNRLDKWCVVEWPNNMRDNYDVDLTEGKVCDTKHNAINAYYIGAVKCLNKIARWLGLEPYADAAALQAAFVEAFYDRERKLFRDSVESGHISMPGNIYAAFYELFPDRAGVKNVIAMIREKRLSQSLLFVTFPLLAFLKKENEDELLRELLTDDQAWLNILAEGGTRTFEGWGRETKWNTSLFHLTLTFGAAFLTDWNISDILSFSEVPHEKH